MNSAVYVFVMGVSGTGKSTLAQEIANSLNIEMVDADDFHSEEAKAIMASGQSIDQATRLKWLNRLTTFLFTHKYKPCVIAYSGLFAAQRKQLMSINKNSLGILLEGDEDIIFERLENRIGHFAPSTMLKSQLELFEPLASDETNVLSLPVLDSTAEQAQQAIAYINELAIFETK
ncbi:gluconokinase [Thalassotalea loyana]|uniref:gluconokinase n=1 Tax=Thalassotalea loyana TaxID=280483 RepID=A0ABQ6HG60_9GAMM|nr:gluconokinase [Thalassotalea loyana]GLX87083.1 gluconokinase [Thalassotalea loyana]